MSLIGFLIKKIKGGKGMRVIIKGDWFRLIMKTKRIIIFFDWGNQQPVVIPSRDTCG